jgi:predicted Ser/Thr protein kinase
VKPARWQQINDLFHEALDRDVTEREAFLRSATEGDRELREEVEALLRSHAAGPDFLDRPAWEVAADLILGSGNGPIVGRQVGPYRVRRELGRGGMGVVYEAEDVRLGRAVALKALAPEFTRDTVRRERLTREARLAAALSHPAVATVYALEEIEDDLYIASELVEGRTLRAELDGGAFPPDRLLKVLIDVAAALAAAHERGIVHRDLKPENVMRRRDGQIKVLDFGLARNAAPGERATMARLTEAGVALGTVGYMAPEQLRGDNVDPRADVFAFGVLAWELATAEHPFGTDPASVLARMTELMDGRSLSRPLPMPGLDAIVRRCIRKLPADRYASGVELLADLRLLERGSGTAQIEAATSPLWWWQCHQLVIAALDAAMVAVVWEIRHWTPRPYGSTIFLALLVLATVSVTLRLNMLFTSRVHREALSAHRARLIPAIAAAEGLLATVLLATAALLAGEHDEIAALLACVGVATLAALAIIEPATTRQAGLSDPSSL